SDVTVGAADPDPIFADGGDAAGRPPVRQGRQPLFDGNAALHAESKAIAAFDLLDGDRPRRLGHGARIVARRDLAHVPAALTRLLAFVLDALNELERAVGFDLALADRPAPERLLGDDLDGA